MTEATPIFPAITAPCETCDGRGFFMYREGQPEHFILNPRYTCAKCRTAELFAFLQRYQTWPAWRRWLWRRGIGT